MRLQGIGMVEGTPAAEIKIGDTLMWNYGGTSEVLEIKKSKTGKTLYLKTRSNSDDKIYDRTLRAKRLVCILKNGKYTLYK